jgi:hypothetical protein
MKLRAALVAIAGAVILLATVAIPESADAAGRVPDASATGRPSVASVSPAAGPLGGGTTITIHGARFSGGAAVTVGGKRAGRVRVKSATVLTAVVPAHMAGAAAIVVTEKAGASTGAVRFEYLSKPAISGMSAHSGPVSGGQVVTITGRNLSYATAVLFGSLPGKVLPGGTPAKIRVQVPVSWAASVYVTVKTLGGTTARSAADWYTFQNPRAQLSGRVSAAIGTVVAAPADVAAVAGGPAVALATAPWTVTLKATAPVPAVGQAFLLRPGGTVYPGGLAGTVTAADAAANTITVAPATLDAAVASATATFSGPIGNASAAVTGTSTRTHLEAHPAGTRPGALTSEIDFGSIDASEAACEGPGGEPVKVTGSFSLTLTNVEAHVQVDTGSSYATPFVDVWVSYQPTIAVSITAAAEASCSLPPAFQNEHEKLFFLGDTGATIAIAPDASFTVSVAGTVTFSQHSYRFLGLVSNPDGSISRLEGQRSDPAKVTVSGQLKAEAYAGVQIQLGELNVIGVGMSIGGGVAGTAESDWPPLVCLSAYPYLRGTLYAYLNLWVKEWKLQGFQVELDLSGISSCSPSITMRAWGETGPSYFGSSPQGGPVPVPGSDASFALGSTFTYALEEDGTVDSLNPSSFNRTPVSGLAGITALAANSDDTVYALRDDGRVLAWNPPQDLNNKPENGNADGALGDGTTRDSAAPVLVRGITTAIAISAGADTAYALLSNGTVMAWGGNEVNQLGDGGNEPYVTAPQLIPGLSGVRQVAGAWQGAFAVLDNGTVMKWGCDAAAASVSPTGVHLVQTTPAPVPGVTHAIAVAGGAYAGYALTASGAVWSWGTSFLGSLGRGNNKAEWYNPALIPGLSRITAIASSQYQEGYALATNGHVYTWGDLTGLTTGAVNAPVEMPGLSQVLTIGAGMYAAWAASDVS